MTALAELISNFVYLDEIVPPAGSKEAPALTVQVEPSDGYVWPAVKNVNLSNAARVILIEAPGAVGKTAAASAIAARLHWPLVNAARAQVGSYSLSGLIQDALGFNSTFLTEVVEGRAGLVVDALDEAHLRAGTANFLAFLENVANLTPVDRPAPIGIVLLSRPDTAEIVRLFFDTNNIPLSTAKIAFFDTAQATSFLTSFMQEKHKEFPHRNYDVEVRYPAAYGELRDLRLRDIATAITSHNVTKIDDVWSDIDGFLGYAPVLSVIAELLAVSNPHAESTTPLSLGTSRTRVLLKIIDRLLEREQTKFREQVLGKLRAELPASADWADPNDVYSPTEQAARLVAQIADLQIVLPIPATLPLVLRETYEKLAHQFLQDHPFLAGKTAVNLVFADYLSAKGALDVTCLQCLTPSSRRAVGDVGPFFHLFANFFAPADSAGFAAIPEGLVAAIVESHAISELETDSKAFIYLEAEGDESATLTLFDLRTKMAEGSDIQFSVVELSGAIGFSSRVPQGMLYTDNAVLLGVPRGHILLGPHAEIVAQEVVIDAEVVSVEPGRDAAGSTSLAAPTITVSGPLTVNVAKPGSFTVVTNNPWPVLRPYAQPSSPPPIVSYADYMNLRAVLRFFKQGAGGFPSVYDEKLDQGIIGSNPIRKRYLDAMLSLGIVEHVNSHYYLHTSKLAERGVQLRSVLNGQPDDPTFSLMRELREATS